MSGIIPILLLLPVSLEAEMGLTFSLLIIMWILICGSFIRKPLAGAAAGAV